MDGENKTVEDVKDIDSMENEQTNEEEEKDEKKDEVQLLKDELQNEKDKYLRLYADFDNYQKRVAKNMLEMQESTKRELINEFLVVLDNMEKAVSISREHKDAIIEGIELTMKSFKDILSKHGIKEVNPVNEDFNPQIHDALMTQPSDDTHKNKVLQTLEKGYLYKEKLIRPAKVVVGSGELEKQNESNN